MYKKRLNLTAYPLLIFSSFAFRKITGQVYEIPFNA